MHVGLAVPSMQNGWVISYSSPKFSPTWELAKDTIVTAEGHGFDFTLCTVQLIGLSGPTQHFHDTLDSMATMAGLATVTERIKLYGSVNVLTMPPALAAKQAQTIGDIAGGRFGLNLVSGLEKGTYTQMGLWPGDQHFATRYDYTAEFTQVVRELWDTGHSDFKGTYFQMDNCMLGPTPQQPIEIVCAGQSEAGTRYCAQYGDYQLAIGRTDAEAMRELVDDVRGQAASFHRDVGVYGLFTIVLRDTVAEAEAAVEDWREHQDYETVAGLAGRDYGEADAQATKQIFYGSDVFMLTFPRIVGDAATVAAKLNELGAIDGFSGALLVFQDYPADVDRFGREVMPLLHGRQPLEAPAGVSAGGTN